MIRMNLTEDELLNLKTVSDYLFFDQYKDTATFPQFERSFGFFFLEKKLPLESIFKEICGEKRKYITFPRLVKAYLLYKNFPGKVSLELKNFFGHIFKNVLKKSGDIVGASTEKAQKFTTVNCKNKDCISKLIVLCDKDKKIKGMKIEYDDSYNAKIYDKKADKVLYVKLEMLFALLDDADKDQKILSNLYASTEPYYRDNITHIFGTFTNKIEFLGFKCRSGKVGFVGKPKGEAFLFGEYGKQFHYLKCEMKKCFTLLNPFFKESTRGNAFLKIKLEEITEDLIVKEPLVADEIHLTRIKDPKMYEKFITNSIIKDNMFFKKNEDDEELLEHDFNTIIDKEPRKWQIDDRFQKVKEDGTLMSLNEILGPCDVRLRGKSKKIKKQRKEDKKREKEEKKLKSKSKKKDRDDSRYDKKEKRKQKKHLLKANKPKKIVTRSAGPRRNYFNRLPENIWNGVSAKNLKSSQILKNKENYKRLLDKIDYDIRNEIHKETEKDKLLKNKNFYDDFLRRHNDIRPPKSMSPKREKNIRKIKKDFDDVKQQAHQTRMFRSRAKNPRVGMSTEAIPERKARLRSTNLRAQPIMYKSNRRGFFDNIFYDDPFSSHFDTDDYYYEYEIPSRKNKYNYFYDDDDDDYYGRKTDKKTSYYNDYDYDYYGKTDKKTNYYNDDDYGYNKKDKKGGYYDYDYEEPKKKVVVEEEEYDPDAYNKKKNDDDGYNNNKYISYFETQIEKDPEKEKKAQENWKNTTEKLKKSQGVNILQTIGAVIKAIHVLQKSEDDIKGSYSLKEKIRLYQILEDNQNIIDFLSQPVPETEEVKTTTGPAIVYDDEELEEDNDEEKNNKGQETEGDQEQEGEDGDDQEVLDELEAGIEGLTLPEINQRIAAIEKLFPTVDEEVNRKRLNDLYEICKKRKNQLIEEEEEQAQQELIKETGVKVNDLVKQEEEKRKQKIAEENEFIKKLQINAFDLAQQQGKKKKHHGNNQKVSITSQPTPKKIYKSQEIYTGKTPFTDPLFPPETKSLCPIDSRGNWILPPDVLEEDVEGWEDFGWCRAEEIFGSEDFQVFHDGVLDDDILQGALGDCYFLSAIAGLCKFPKLIEKLFYFKEKSEEHCYGVYFCINGSWELVLVDDYVPCSGRYAKRFAFSSANGNELWVVLLEKAWAKINGSYAKVGCGGLPHEVFEVTTEAYCDKFDISPRFENQIWEGLMKGQEQGFIMTAGTSCDTANLDIEEMGLVPGHAYTILGIYEIGGERLVHIRNPWGAGEWNGDWSDSSDRWTPSIRRQLGLSGREKDDGEFFMSFSDYLKYFCMMGICKLHEDYLYVSCRIRKTMANVPNVIQIDVPSNNTHVYIQQYQKNPRIILNDGTYQNPVIAYMLLVDSQYNYIASVSKAEMSLCIEQTLKKGTYYLITDINYRYANNGKILGYCVSTYASQEVPLQNVTKTVEAGPIITKAVSQYCKQKLTPTKESGGAVTSYISKAYSQDFPFVSALFENNSKSPVTVQFSVKCRGMKSFCFYNEPTSKDTDTTLSKTIPANQSGLVLILNYSLSSMFSFSYDVDAEIDEGSLDDTVFNEEAEALDDDGTINQYVHEERNGYLIGLENKRKTKLRMKLEIEGLEFSDKEHRGQKVWTFEIERNSRKVFPVKVRSGYSGEVTFGFNFA